MVIGFERFREAFRAFAENYVVIGGSACDWLFTSLNAQLPAFCLLRIFAGVDLTVDVMPAVAEWLAAAQLSAFQRIELGGAVDGAVEVALDRVQGLALAPEDGHVVSLQRDDVASADFRGVGEALPGVEVPRAEDVQLAGFDDREISRQFTPMMTTINQPSAELAVAAFRLLMDRMHDPSAAPAHKVLPFVLEENSSTR